MNHQKKKIVAKLGRLCGCLDNLESLPGNHGCATIIRKARMLAQQIRKDLSNGNGNFMTANRVITVVKCLVDFLILLDKLKNYFNFYKQPFYGHEYSS